MSDRALPVLIVKPGTISKEDISRAEKSGFICIIECNEPDAARFLEPPITEPIDAQSRAALSLFRMILTSGNNNTMWEKGALVSFWAKALTSDSSPTPVSKVKGKV